jgi:hypothetical protein
MFFLVFDYTINGTNVDTKNNQEKKIITTDALKLENRKTKPLYYQGFRFKKVLKLVLKLFFNFRRNQGNNAYVFLHTQHQELSF